MTPTVDYQGTGYSESGYGFTTTTDTVKNEYIVKARGPRVRKGDRKAYESIWPGKFNRFNRKIK